MSTAYQLPAANQFTLGRLCGMMAQYALVLGVVRLLDMSVVALAIALVALTLALIAQPWLIPPRPEWPTYSRVGLYVAYYATVAAIATAGCFFAFGLDPQPPPPPEYTTWLGRTFGPANDALGWMLVVIFLYFLFASFLCTIGLHAALLAIRRSTLAWVLVLLNLPGTIFFGVLLFALISGNPEGD